MRTNLVYSKSATLLPETRSKRARSSAISATRSSGPKLRPRRAGGKRIAIRVAEARHKLAQSQLERTQKLINRNFASIEELNIQIQDEVVQRLSIEEARQNKRMAELQRKQMEATIRSREIRSPHDGVVVEVLKVPGQSVSGLDSVLRVVVPANPSHWLPRRARCLARAAGPGREDLGRIWVPSWRTRAFAGQVEYVDLLISPESRTCKVTAIVPNREDRLRSGLEGRMEIYLGGPGGNPAKPLR